MKLKPKIAKLEDVEEKFRGLYVEADGGFKLDIEVEGYESPEAVDRLKRTVASVRTELATAKAEAEKFKDIDPDKIEEQAAELEELRAKVATAADPKNQEAVDKLVATRVQNETRQLRRDLTKAQNELTKFQTENQTLRADKAKSTIEGEVRKAAATLKLLPSAIEDAIMHAERTMEVTADGKVVTKDNAGVTPGITAEEWLGEDMKSKRPHWFEGSIGGGGPGNKEQTSAGKDNPWTKAGWNVTQQMQLEATDKGKAERMAKAAGVELGATKPAEPAGAAK